MEINAFEPSVSRFQANFNPIQNYNNFLQGGTSFDVNTDFQKDFDRILQKEMEESKKPLQSKMPNLSSADTLMNSIEKGFANGLNDVNDKRVQLDNLQEAFARGEDVSVHDLMIASEKSALSMQMAMQIRNKMISAYTDIKNMSF